MICARCGGACGNGCYQSPRTIPVNPFSKDYKAGQSEGRIAEAGRTSDALIELETKGIISNAQLQAILDLILEKLTDVMDID
jgi:hypothetical protein